MSKKKPGLQSSQKAPPKVTPRARSRRVRVPTAPVAGTQAPGRSQLAAGDPRAAAVRAVPVAPPVALPTAPLGSRAKQKQDTRTRVRDAARTLFIRDGYHATTAESIAELAGVAKGTVFVHAQDKLDLLMLVMHDQLAATVSTSCASLPNTGLLPRLMHLFGGLFEMYSTHPKLSAAFLTHNFVASGPHSKQLNALTFSFLGQLAALVSEAQKRAEVGSHVDPMLAASNFFSIYWMSLMAWASEHMSWEAALAVLQRSLELQFRGLAPSAKLAGHAR